MTRRSGTAFALLAGLLLVLLPATGWADPVRPSPGRPFFGPHLPYPDDTPAAYVERLGGLEPSTYTLPIPYPLDTGAVSQLRQYAELVAERGAVLIVDVQPAVRLQQLDDPAVADRLAATLADLHATYGTHALLRFAPEMNGSWETWGQQPGAYVRAFRTLAEAMDRVEQSRSAGDDWSEMVWAPVYGSGYPFRRPDREGGAQGALQQVIRGERGRTDTNHDGRLDTRDDPYAPYYPGDRWVDWVGLSMYRLGQSQGVRRNRVPPPTEFRQRLEETWGYGYGGPSQSFYDRYAVGHDRPMLVETAAFFNPADPGPRALEVKSAWWRQVFGVLDDYRRIAGISWLEVARTEPEALQQEPVDWRVSAPPRVATAFAHDLRRAPLTLGPVLEPYVPPTGSGPGSGTRSGTDANAPAAAPLALSSSWEVRPWLVAAALLLLLSLLVGRVLPQWRRRALTDRDERLDLLRGGLLTGLVLTLLVVTGFRAWWPADPITVWSGAGLLLLVSGTAHGLRYREVVAGGSPWVGTVTRWRRARTLYVVALLTAGLGLLLDALPGVATDLGTYPHAGALLDYPPPAYAFWDLLSFDAAPWLVGTLGLVAVLVAVSPVLLWLLHRGWWWAPLVVSWALFLVWAATGATVLPLASEATLPVLAWQLPFVHGLVLGHQRDALERRAGAAGVVATVLALAYAALVLVPVLPDSDGVVLRVELVAALGFVAAAALAVVTTAWVPLRLLLGWLLLPVGRRPLVVVPFAVVAVVVADVLVR